MVDAYEDVVVMEAIDDLIEAMERTIDATETEPAIISTALTVLAAKHTGRFINSAEGRQKFAQKIIEFMEIMRSKDN
jgi:hypothetical protein